jgi:hypothetical protein
MSTQFWMAVRQAVLMFLDALERELEDKGVLIKRTAEIRKEWKELRRGGIDGP